MAKGKDWWDSTGIAFRPDTWKALAQHLLPGAFGLAFASARGWHRLACAIEDAGLRIHPSLFCWANGSSFPKATRILDERFDGHRYGGQVLKGSVEPIICFQKPYAGKPQESITQYGAGALWIDGSRVSGPEPHHNYGRTSGANGFAGASAEPFNTPASGRWPPNFVMTHVSIPIMRLKGHLPCSIIDTIRRYYYGYTGVSDVRTRKAYSTVETERRGEVLQSRMQEQVTHEGSNAQAHGNSVPELPEPLHCPESMVQEWTQEVLFKQMSRSLSEAVHRAEVSPIRETPQRCCSRQDKQDTDRTRCDTKRAESSLLEGGKTGPPRGLCVCHDPAAHTCSATSRTADETAREVYPRTSPRDGGETQQTATCIGACASHQWSEGRQQAGESCHRGQGESFESASQDRCGDGSSQERECGLEVLARDIPPGWLEYFEPTGEDLGCRPLGPRQVRGHKGYPNGPGGSSCQLSQKGTPTTRTEAWHGYAAPDGTETVQAWACADGCPVAALDRQAGERRPGHVPRTAKAGSMFFPQPHVDDPGSNNAYGDTGGASRFFPTFAWSLDVAEQLAAAAPVRYCPKASASERSQGLDGRNPHATLKPLSLCQWLATLLSPPDAYKPRRLLVPFCGTGSECIGAMLSGGFEDITGIEKSQEYCALAEARLRYHVAQHAAVQPTLFPEAR